MLGKKLGIALIVVILGIAYNYFYTKPKPGPNVRTTNGEISGVIMKSRNGRDYFTYWNIPYAQPPVGDLRFEPPVPVKNWEGIRDGSLVGPKCLQYDMMAKSVGGKEDCLILNVHTPNTSEVSMLPVMVFFHGGIFMLGYGSMYNPINFMDEDVVLVTVNYRLGALGFLNTGDGRIKGNMGLKDQTRALRWVQENIYAFGENKDSVTIFGQSAGASCVHYHILSPLSKGLFHRAISQSGTAISHWARFSQPQMQAKRFAGQVHCPTTPSQEMVDCLKKIPPHDIVSVHKEVSNPLPELKPITFYTPTVETVEDPTNFLPVNQTPLEILKSGKINRVPWIVGANSEDDLVMSAAVFRNDSLVEQLESDFPFVVSKLMNLEYIPPTTKELQSLEEFYIGKTKTHDRMEKFGNYTNLFSDRMFFVPVHRSAKTQSNFSSVYLYYYSHRRDNSLAIFLLADKGKYPVILEIAYAVISRWIKRNIFGMELSNYGVCHADEMVMFFTVFWDSEIRPGHSDYDLSVQLVRLWTSFAKNEKQLIFNNTAWNQVESGSKVLKYLNINRSTGLIEELFSERMNLWNTLYP